MNPCVLQIATMSFPKRSFIKSFTKKSLFPMIISMLFRGALAQNDPLPFLSSSAFPIEITELNCPKPMIWYTGSNITSDMYCIEQCCLPCPYIDNFYPDGVLGSIYKTFAVFGIVSFSLMFTMAVWFLLLPSQKSNPTTKLILLPFTMSVCWFEFSEFFTLQQQKSQCINPVLRANIHDNYYCAVQAFSTLGGAYAMASWAALLMLHLHMISVWRSDFIIRNIFYINIYIWITSLLAAIIPLTIDKVEASNICFISNKETPIYYYFMSFIYISFIAHLATFAYMTKVTIRANWRISADSAINKRISTVEAQRAFNHVKSVFTLQWRALLGALLMLVVYLINWIYFIIISSVSIDYPRFSQWTRCLLDGGSRTSCSPKFVPSLSWTITLLFFNRFLGILIFIILAAKKTVFVEVWNLLNGRREMRSTTSLAGRSTLLTSIERGERLGRVNGGDTVRSGMKIRISDVGETSSSKLEECMAAYDGNRRSSGASSIFQKFKIPGLETASSSLESRKDLSGPQSHPLPSTPARASFGILYSPSSDSWPHSRRLSSKHISFSSESSESGRRASFTILSHPDNKVEGVGATAPNGTIIKVSRAHQRRKRQSRELAAKIARNSITEVSENDEILENNKGDPQKRKRVQGEFDGSPMTKDDKIAEKRATFGDEKPENWILNEGRPQSSSEP